MGQDSNLLQAGHSRYWIPGGTTAVQTSPGAHPAVYKMDAESFQEVKQLGHCINNPPASSTEVKEIVEPYLYTPSVPSWHVVGWCLTILCPVIFCLRNFCLVTFSLLTFRSMSKKMCKLLLSKLKIWYTYSVWFCTLCYCNSSDVILLAVLLISTVRSTPPSYCALYSVNNWLDFEAQHFHVSFWRVIELIVTSTWILIGEINVCVQNSCTESRTAASSNSCTESRTAASSNCCTESRTAASFNHSGLLYFIERKKEKRNGCGVLTIKWVALGWDCVVHVVTEVGDGWSGFECQQGQEIFSPKHPDQPRGLPSFLFIWLGAFSVLRLRLSGAVPLFHLYTFMTWTGKLLVMGDFAEAELWLQQWQGVPGPLQYVS
jgi:hypothetical protein